MQNTGRVQFNFSDRLERVFSTFCAWRDVKPTMETWHHLVLFSMSLNIQFQLEKV